LPWQQAMSFGVKVIELGDLKSSRKKKKRVKGGIRIIAKPFSVKL
jgi:hypothetical protein